MRINHICNKALFIKHLVTSLICLQCFISLLNSTNCPNEFKYTCIPGISFEVGNMVYNRYASMNKPVSSVRGACRHYGDF